MDYGQPVNNLKGGNILTPDFSRGEKNHGATEQVSAIPTPERDLRKIGNDVLNTPDQASTQEVDSGIAKEKDSLMPPGYSAETTPNASDTNEIRNIENSNKKAIDFSKIREGKTQKISEETSHAVVSVINDFEKGKIDPAELVDYKSELSEAYLKNSFGREIGKAA